MDPILNLLDDDAVRERASRSNIRLGHELWQATEVMLGAFRPERIDAKVEASSAGEARSMSFELVDGELRWKCTCTADPKLFCKHLVAAALEAQSQGRGDMRKAAGVIIRDRKMLLERSVGKPAFIAPGGRIKDGETAEEALVRELEEEFGIGVREHDLELLGRFSAAAANHPGQQVHMDVFMVKAWQGDIVPHGEVEELLWTDSSLPEGVTIGSIFGHEVVPMLRERDLID